MASFFTQSAPLWPSGEGASSLSDVIETAGRRHEHGVDIYLLKERGWDSDGGWYADLGSLAELALMAGADVPLDVVLKGGVMFLALYDYSFFLCHMTPSTLLNHFPSPDSCLGHQCAGTVIVLLFDSF